MRGIQRDTGIERRGGRKQKQIKRKERGAHTLKKHDMYWYIYRLFLGKEGSAVVIPGRGHLRIFV